MDFKLEEVPEVIRGNIGWMTLRSADFIDLNNRITASFPLPSGILHIRSLQEVIGLCLDGGDVLLPGGQSRVVSPGWSVKGQ